MGWSADDIPDQTGRTVVVTGSNSGIGLEATRELARAGATVVMACRSVERANEAAAEIYADVGNSGELVIEELDLGDLESVRTFADRLDDRGVTIDVHVNNAGVMAIPRRETSDGFETQFGVNHLGHFALTGHLLDREQLADDARVVTLSSGVHERGEIDFHDLHGEDEYDPWDAYAQSKLANVLFAYELERRFRADDADRQSSVVHPGYANTDLQFRGPRAEGSTLRLALMRLLNAVVAQSAAAGALPTLYAATAPDAEGGAYYGPGGLFDMRGSPARQGSSERSYDRETARRLWEVSAELTGVTYPLPEPAAASPSPAE